MLILLYRSKHDKSYIKNKDHIAVVFFVILPQYFKSVSFKSNQSIISHSCKFSS